MLLKIARYRLNAAGISLKSASQIAAASRAHPKVAGAPRLAHTQGPDEQGIAANRVREVPSRVRAVDNSSAGSCRHRSRFSAPRHHDVRAVVSLSAFAHRREVTRNFMTDKHLPYPVLGWYVMGHVERVIGVSFDEIAPLNTLPRARRPTLLVQGRRDTVVPVKDAHRLLAASSRARLLLVDADHDLRGSLAPHARTLTDFLRAAC